MTLPLDDAARARLREDALPLLAREESPPEWHSRYRIVRTLGQGGMGTVYEAEDLRLGRSVALKVPHHLAGSDPALRERFRREALAAARIDHPHVANVYDAPDGAIVFRLVRGRSLAEVQPIEFHRAAHLVRDAASAVHAAHELGIIHRDLKPQNLLAEGDHVFVTDFGLAKTETEDAHLTASGAFLGTPAYMAPEQARGDNHRVDARTDVYGLGATLFSLVTGQPPFSGTSGPRLLDRILHETAQRADRLNPKLPRDLATVIAACLEKEPDRRYQSARLLAGDLERWQRGLTIAARPASIVYRMASFCRRKRAAVIAVLGAIVVALVLGLGILHARGKARTAEEALVLSERVTRHLEDRTLHWRLGDLPAARAEIDHALAATSIFLREHDVAMAYLLHGRVLRRAGRFEESRGALNRALALDSRLVEALLERGLAAAEAFATGAAALSHPVHVAEPLLPAPLASLRTAALADLKTVLADPPRSRRIDLLLAEGEVAALEGGLTAAARAFGEATRLSGGAEETAALWLPRIALAEGDGDRAWHLAMSAVDLYRGFGPAYLAQGGSAAGGSPLPDAATRATRQHALSAADERLSRGDESAEAWYERASARLQIADIDGALADFSKALALDPSDATALGNRALIHVRRAATGARASKIDTALEGFDQAIHDFTECLVLAPHLAGAMNNRGVARVERVALLRRKGEVAAADEEVVRARRDFDDAITAAPRFALAYLNRASLNRRAALEILATIPMVARELGRDAIRDYEEALRLDPRPEQRAAILPHLAALRELSIE